MEPARYKVVIVGAGAAGLECARELQNTHGLKNDEVLVLEARNAIGGRICQSADVVPGHLVEVGAEFIHGSTTRLNEYAKQFNWDMHSLFTWAHGDGGPDDELASDGGYALYYVGRDKQLLQWDSKAEDFVHLNEVLGRMAETSPEITDKDPRNMEEFLLQNGVSDRMMAMAHSGYANTAGCKLNELSASGAHRLERGWTNDDGDGDFRLRKTFRVLLDALLQTSKGPTHIKTGSPVQRIDWDRPDQTVVVEYTNTRRKERHTVVADCVVVTVPLPLLHQQLFHRTMANLAGPNTTAYTEYASQPWLEFNPPLPQSKLLAGNALGVGQASKLLMTFRERIAPEGCHGMICSDCLIPEMWFRELKHPDGTSTHLVTGYLMTTARERTSELGEDRTVEAALAQLAEIFPTSRPHDHLIRGILHEWKDEPYVHSAYTHPLASHLVPGIDPKYQSTNALVELARPLPNGRVMFAGECYNLNANMTLHGALDAGARAAAEAATTLARPRSRL